MKTISVTISTEFVAEVPEGASPEVIRDAIMDYMAEREGYTFEAFGEDFYGREWETTIEQCSSWEVSED